MRAGSAAFLALGLVALPHRAAAIEPAHAEAAGRVLGAELTQGQAYAILQHLTDRVGPRLSGSPAAEAAVRWTAERLEAMGLVVRREKLMVPRWVRGVETAEILAPILHPLVVTALGGSEATPEAGLTAEVVAVDSFEALKALGEAKLRGKIVLYNKAMRAPADYGRTAALRSRGAVEAGRFGAVASLVRSLGTLSARLPHTGGMSYQDGVPPIPAAAVTVEDAELIQRLLDAGERVTLRLRLGCRTLPDVESANVVADLEGRERPDQVVLIGAHLDSWDLGTGAIDDGAGVAMVMESLRLLRQLKLVPRRTVRGVLFMNEENGLRGGKAYALDHAAELPRHVAAIETDSGAGRPLGFSASVGAGGLQTLRELAELLRGLGASEIGAGGGGADITPLGAAGVPLLDLRVDTTHYFDVHHTAADTLDKVEPRALAESTAALAVMAYLLAEIPETLPRAEPSAGRR